MSIFLTGEDGYTLYSILTPHFIEMLKKDLDLKSIDDIWFRPSFGRGAGPKKKKEEKGYSGFGESDAMITGKGIDRKTKIVFLESKIGNINSKKSQNDLRYQFLVF